MHIALGMHFRCHTFNSGVLSALVALSDGAVLFVVSDAVVDLCGGVRGGIVDALLALRPLVFTRRNCISINGISLIHITQIYIIVAIEYVLLDITHTTIGGYRSQHERRREEKH